MDDRRPSALARSVDLPLLAGLDGLRAVAVSVVIIDHFRPGIIPGGYGVMLFFVLSGFLITRLLLREQRRSGGISLRRFYGRRVLRIFPAFYAYWFGIMALLVATDRAVPWAHAWSAFVYFSNYFNAINGDPNTAFSHTWSLAAEEQFYLIWPLVLIALLKYRASLLRPVLLVVVSIWVLRFVLVYGFSVPQQYLYASFETRADALLVGCALAIALEQRNIADRLQSLVARGAVAPITIASVMTLAILGYSIGTSQFRDTIVFMLLPVIFAVLIAHVVAAPNSVLTRLLEIRSIAFVGRISYGMYLYQQIVVYPAGKLLRPLPFIVQLAGVFLITILVATASYFLIERPFLQLKSRLSGAEPAPTTPQAATVLKPGIVSDAAAG